MQLCIKRTNSNIYCHLYTATAAAATTTTTTTTTTFILSAVYSAFTFRRVSSLIPQLRLGMGVFYPQLRSRPIYWI
jgi:predicted CxxxxCH...CXXCH cytochrome family protein